MKYRTLLPVTLAVTLSALATWAFVPPVAVGSTAPPQIIRIETVRETVVFKPLSEFPSKEALESWCQENIAVLMCDDPDKADCDDYAEYLQRKAAEDGYLLSVCPVMDGKVYGVKVTDVPGAHMGNLAMIGNEIYYIEPQPGEYQIVFVTYRD